MKEQRPYRFTPTARGFTLIEILVVIAIIAVLGSISAPIIMRQMNKARALKTATIQQQIQMAAEDYHSDYGAIYLGSLRWSGSRDASRGWTARHYPYSWSSTLSGANTSTSADTDIRDFLRALNGEVTSASVISPREKKYMSISDVQNNKAGIYRDGNGNLNGIVDAWGRGMLLLLDTDYDGDYTFGRWEGDANGKTIRGSGDLLHIISGGPDTVFKGGDDVMTVNK